MHRLPTAFASRWSGLVASLLLLTAACSSGGAVAPASTSAIPSASRSLAASGPASSTPATKLTGVFTSFSGDQIPVWLGIDSGIFRRHGIDLSMSLLQESP